MDNDFPKFERNLKDIKWGIDPDELLEFSYGGTDNDDDVVDSSVNHPSHYTSGGQEAIDTIEDAVKDAPDAVVGGLQWNALKYLLRLWLKDNPKNDALKARWYLDRLIDKL